MQQENQLPAKEFKGKIAVATNDQIKVTGHIGRCRAFVVFELAGNRIINREVRGNIFTNHSLAGQLFSIKMRGRECTAILI